MDIDKVLEKRKQKLIISIEKNIEKLLIKFGWSNFCIYCPKDLYGEIKNYFELKGFKVWREKYELLDMDDYETGEYDYNTYIGL